MGPVFASLVPVFLIVATGWLSRATGLIGDQHWAGVEKTTYFLFFPALIMDTLARADLGSVPVLGVSLALIGAILLVAGLLLTVQPVLDRAFGIDGPSFTSVFQGATRWNTFVAIAVAGSLFGQRGVALIAVGIAAMVPLLNVLAVYVLVRFAGRSRQNAGPMMRAFVTNPLIWSCAVGLLLNLAAPILPKPILAPLDMIGRAALPAGLLVVGAALDLRELARPGPAHAIALVLKLLLLPILAALMARTLGVAGSDIGVTVIAAAVPTASNAYVLAKQLGGNAPLMAEILTLQTLAALMTMPAMMAWLG
jgi:malonate transporter and related proteins